MTRSDPARHFVFLSDAPATGAAVPVAQLPPVPASPGATPISDPASARFFEQLMTRSGLEARRYRTAVLERRAPACLRALRASGFDQATDMIQESDEAHQRALGTALVGVTSFFRDPGAFDALGQAAGALARGLGRGLRVLSVGCSTGAEAYSVAMLFEQRGVPLAALVGVDCRREAVRQAGLGLYPEDALEGVPAPLLERWFEPRAEGHRGQRRVGRELRERVRWWVADAFALPTGEPWDVVLCRNLAIYLEPGSVQELWTRLARTVRPGGLLVVGKAERPQPESGFRRQRGCLYRRVEVQVT